MGQKRAFPTKIHQIQPKIWILARIWWIFVGNARFPPKSPKSRQKRSDGSGIISVFGWLADLDLFSSFYQIFSSFLISFWGAEIVYFRPLGPKMAILAGLLVKIFQKSQKNGHLPQNRQFPAKNWHCPTKIHRQIDFSRFPCAP